MSDALRALQERLATLRRPSQKAPAPPRRVDPLPAPARGTSDGGVYSDELALLKRGSRAAALGQLLPDDPGWRAQEEAWLRFKARRSSGPYRPFGKCWEL